MEGDGEDEVVVVDAVERVDLHGDALLGGRAVDLGAVERPRGDELGTVVLVDGVTAGPAIPGAQRLAIDLDVRGATGPGGLGDGEEEGLHMAPVSDYCRGTRYTGIRRVEKATYQFAAKVKLGEVEGYHGS